MANLIELLKETLLAKNLSPEQAAVYLGCSGRQIRRWIKGEIEPSPIYLRAIATGIIKINDYKICPLCSHPIKKED